LTASMVVTHGSLQRAPGRCALTIGNFDGVHRGHRALIDRVTAKARELDLISCVLTFEPHPREFFAGEAAPARLTRLRDKLELMETMGVQRGHVARFDARFAALSARRVAHGAKLGRSLGFPTANIVLRRPAPLSGIFVVEVDGLGRGVASLGKRPTINPVPVPLLEVHLFDYEQDLYGEHLRVRFLKK